MEHIIRGRLALPGGILNGDARIRDGIIVEIAPRLTGAPTTDFGDKLVLPGATDAHVHFRDPGHPEKEDFTSGTTAAAFGGVTCVLDMPNTDPPVIDLESLRRKRERVAPKALVDFGLFVGLSTRQSLDALGEAVGLKTYLGASTGNLLVRDPALVREAIHATARAGKVAAFHAEDQACMDEHHARERAAPDAAAHARARPNRCEAESIEMLKALDRPDDARVHVCHLSTREGLAAIEGTTFTSEVAPHHLFLTVRNLATGYQKMNPPLRSDEDARALYDGLATGRVDMLASDHAPHTPAEKGRASIWECPAGVPGVETMVPMLMAEVAAGRFPLPRLVDAACARPAEVYGLNKGKIAVGYDADFAVYDPAQVRTVRAADLHSRAGWTPFEGRDAVFPTDVIVRGALVIANGKLVGRAGHGACVRAGHAP